MHRRQFLRAGAAGVALSTLGRTAGAFPAAKPPRVGMIGSGWYGKIDLLRMIQVAPVNVVSLCDVDRRMLSAAADMVASRQATKKRPRTFTDYREMLKQNDLDIVFIATPDHWHALPMIAAAEAGADIYLQKPISIDVAEGQAMLAAAPSTTVWSRWARNDAARRTSLRPATASSAKASWAAWAWSRSTATITCARRQSARHPPAGIPRLRNVDRACTMRPYNSIVHPRGWRAFTEYSNGIVGDMCVHMLDTVRWMLGLGWPKSVSSAGGIFVSKGTKANISDTQTATFDYGDLNIVWQHRTWGPPPDPKYSWGMTFYGDKGTLKASVMSYDFTPEGPGESLHCDVAYRAREVSRGRDRGGHRDPRLPRVTPAHEGFSQGHRHAQAACSRHRRRPHFHGELHSGQPLHEARPHARLGR